MIGIVTAMVDSVQLECPIGGCTLGDNGSKYKTPKLGPEMAMRMLEIHAKSHDQGQEGGQRHHEPGDGCHTKPEKTRRPSLQKGISEDRFLTFQRMWARCKTSTGMKEMSMLRAQLLDCCSIEFGEDLDNLHGSQLDQMEETELMAEMRKLAVVAQNNLVNIVRLRSMMQDRDETIRSFLARLKGAAAVCKLTVQCSCGQIVSYSDKETIHCIIKGLADEEIRKQVLGVVDEMNLDATVRFVEAKESGRKAGKYLDSSEAEVSKVTGYKAHLKEQQLAERVKAEDEVKCRFCGKRGHGGSPNFAVKKEKCSAFDKRCNTCGKIGHFSKTKACRQGIAKVEELVVQHERRTGQSDVGACAVVARAGAVQSEGG